jgi:hypothetical protein
MSDLDMLAGDLVRIVEEDISAVPTRKRIAAVARESLAEFKAQNRRALGRTPAHSTTVDGALGASEDRVRFGGEIVYEFDLVEEAFAWIADALERHSPVLSEGRDPDRSVAYAKSHEFTADGVVADPRGQVPQAREWMFRNTTPYARKIERGMSPQAPEGVYDAVAVLAAERFPRLSIRVRYVDDQPAIVIRRRRD